MNSAVRWVPGSRAVGILPLDESLERLEQGDLQLQIRMGESDRQFRRMVTAQHSIGQPVLLGGLFGPPWCQRPTTLGFTTAGATGGMGWLNNRNSKCPH